MTNDSDITKVLHFYVDTNLFIECRPLDQLGWSNWEKFETIKLIVSRPVQREIDNQKYRGNGRVAKRARSTYSLFRKIIMGDNSQSVIQTDNPRVELILEAPSNPDTELSNDLDYSKADDNIIGCMSNFVKSNSDADVRLLTNDAGPAMTAQSMSLQFEFTPQDWLIAPESNDYEREITRLNEEISTLTKQEPTIEIECQELDSSQSSQILLHYEHFEPLSETVTENMMDEIRSRFPMIKTFDTDPKPPTRQQLRLGLTILAGSYSPPTREAIDKYQRESYPHWIGLCGSMLKNIHQIEQRLNLPTITVIADNVGTRPANHALCIFKAKGNFKMLPPLIQRDVDEMKELTRFQLPPEAPRGTWRSTAELLLGGFSNSALEIPSFMGSDLINNDIIDARDPNDFYYKPERSKKPMDAYELECEQWRHNSGALGFEIQMIVDNVDQQIRGAVEIEIHAENLTHPATKIIPIRFDVKSVNLEDHVRKMISNM